MTKKIAIMQPYFFPYIGYWQLIGAVDKFIIYDDVNYISRGYINRNYISLQGQRHRITLSLQKASINKLINEIEIGGNKKDIRTTLHHAYNKAPYFEENFPVIEGALMNKESNLAKYLGHQIEAISNHLGIHIQFEFSSNLSNNKSLRGEDKILDICQLEKATTYINPIGGIELYNKEMFKKNGVDLLFINADESMSKLSIIDPLITQGKKDTHQLLSKYSLE